MLAAQEYIKNYLYTYPAYYLETFHTFKILPKFMIICYI